MICQQRPHLRFLGASGRLVSPGGSGAQSPRCSAHASRCPPAGSGCGCCPDRTGGPGSLPPCSSWLGNGPEREDEEEKKEVEEEGGQKGGGNRREKRRRKDHLIEYPLTLVRKSL